MFIDFSNSLYGTATACGVRILYEWPAMGAIQASPPLVELPYSGILIQGKFTRSIPVDGSFVRRFNLKGKYQ